MFGCGIPRTGLSSICPALDTVRRMVISIEASASFSAVPASLRADPTPAGSVIPAAVPAAPLIPPAAVSLGSAAPRHPAAAPHRPLQARVRKADRIPDIPRHRAVSHQGTKARRHEESRHQLFLDAAFFVPSCLQIPLHYSKRISHRQLHGTGVAVEHPI